MIELKYDRTVDALAIVLRPGDKSARTIRVTDDVRVDLDSGGRLVTIELLNASEHASQAALDAHARDVLEAPAARPRRPARAANR